MNHLFDFVGFFKVIQLVGFDPPCRHGHERFWVVIFVGKECIKRESDVVAFCVYLCVTNIYHF